MSHNNSNINFNPFEANTPPLTSSHPTSYNPFQPAASPAPVLQPSSGGGYPQQQLQPQQQQQGPALGDPSPVKHPSPTFEQHFAPLVPQGVPSQQPISSTNLLQPTTPTPAVNGTFQPGAFQSPAAQPFAPQSAFSSPFQQRPTSSTFQPAPTTSTFQQTQATSTFQQAPPSSTFQQAPPSSTFQQAPPSSTFQNPTPSNFQAHPVHTPPIAASHVHNSPTGQPSHNTSSHVAAAFDPFGPPPPVQIPAPSLDDSSTTASALTAAQGAPTPARSSGSRTPSPTARKKILQRIDALCKQGILSHEEGTLLRENVDSDSGRKAIRSALRQSEDGDVTPLKQLLYNLKWNASAGPLGRDKPSDTVVDDADSDDDDGATSSDETMSTISAGSGDGSSRTIGAGAAGAEEYHAPHPYAGRYTGIIPAGMSMNDDLRVFSGVILWRVSSKKLFRKWKKVHFELDLNCIKIQDVTRSHSAMRTTLKVIPIHHLQTIGNPSLKRTFSLMDDGQKVYYTSLRSNDLDALDQYKVETRSQPSEYIPGLKFSILCKLGSTSPHEVTAVAHAILSVILYKRKQHQEKAKAGLHKQGGAGGFQVSGRYA